MHNLPTNWQVKSLGEVADFIAGQSPPSSTYNQQKIGLPFYQGKADFGEKYPSVRIWCSEPTKIALPNDILISVRAPVGPTNICDTEACIGRGLSAIRVKKNSDYRFILYYLRSFENKLVQQGRGSTFAAITQLELKKLPIPLPTLPIQKQIAEILEKTDQAKQKRKETNKLTDEFLQSVFIEMFGDPVKNPKGWDLLPLKDVCSEIIDCPHSTPIHSDSKTEYPCIRTTEMKDGYIDWTAMKYLNYDDYIERIKRLEPLEGDVIFAREGNFGEAVRIPPKTKISLGQRTLLFRPKDKICNSIYLWSFVRSYGFYIQASSKNSGSTVPHVNVKDIRNFLINIPPLSPQQQFAEIVNKTEALKEKQKQSVQELENLFQSLMQQAFKGELV